MGARPVKHLWCIFVCTAISRAGLSSRRRRRAWFSTSLPVAAFLLSACFFAVAWAPGVTPTATTVVPVALEAFFVNGYLPWFLWGCIFVVCMGGTGIGRWGMGLARGTGRPNLGARIRWGRRWTLLDLRAETSFLQTTLFV